MVVLETFWGVPWRFGVPPMRENTETRVASAQAVSVSSDWLSVIARLIFPPASLTLASVQISIGELIWLKARRCFSPFDLRLSALSPPSSQPAERRRGSGSRFLRWLNNWLAASRLHRWIIIFRLKLNAFRRRDRCCFCRYSANIIASAENIQLIYIP